MAIPLTVNNVDTICCMGAGRVGILSMAALAERCRLGNRFNNIRFVVLDSDADIINRINQNLRLPFEEPGAENFVTTQIGFNNLEFSHDIAGELNQCRMIFIAVRTPSMEKPRSVEGNLDVRYLETALWSILDSMNHGNPGEEKYVAVKSTLPVDYRGRLLTRLRQHPNINRLNIITNPEFFSKGTAVHESQNPHRVVLGRFHREGRELFGDLYQELVINPNQIEMVGLSAAELGKLLSNAAIAAKLTVMNIGSSICEEAGTNFDDVRRSLMANPRIDPSHTNTAPGYGGLGLNRDVKYLAYLCSEFGLTSEMDFFTKLIKMRKQKMDRMVNTIITRMGTPLDRRDAVGVLERRRVCIYGFANKVGTDDIRDSPAIYICTQLLKVENIDLVICDPVVRCRAMASCFLDKYRHRVRVRHNVIAAGVGAHGMVFFNQSQGFRDALANHLVQMVDAMITPRAIFDCCNVINTTPNIAPPALLHLNANATIYRLGMPV